MLLQSTVATAAGMALMLWPPASDFIFTKSSANVRALSFIVGAILIFIGSLLCTAGNSGPALRGVGAGSIVVALSAAFLIAAPHLDLEHHVSGGKNFNPRFLQAVAGYFAFAGVSAFFASFSAGGKAAKAKSS